MRLKYFVATVILAFAPALSFAQSVGEAEYMNSCAACHGADGTGGGPMVGYLMGSIPDLTVLSDSNGGVFPITKVYSTIDGTMTSGPHGSSEMPIWGQRYAFRGRENANPDFRAEEAEVFVRFRVLALTEYLASIQN